MIASLAIEEKGVAVAVQGGSVYWTTDDANQGLSGGVYKVERCGGAVSVVALPQFLPTALVVNASHVFWGTSSVDPSVINSVYRAPGDGEDAWTTVAPGLVLRGGLALDESFVYWSSSERVRRSPLLGGAIEDILVSSEAFGPIAVDATYLFASQPDAVPVKSRLVRVPLAGSQPVAVLATAVAPSSPLTTDETSVYYVANGSQVMRLSKQGGSPTALATAVPAAMAVDATHLYWIEGEAHGNAVRRVAKDGGPVQTLAPLGAFGVLPGGVALDDEAVYWLDGPRVMRLRK